MTQPKHFLSILDLTADELKYILKQALMLKGQPSGRHQLADKLLVTIFQKPSLRTRLSFEKAMNELGGQFTYYNMQDIGLGEREPIFDVAQVASRMCDVICARVFKHKDVAELAQYSRVPVINALSDLEHPCQALADVLTILEHKADKNMDKLKGLQVSYVGDCNNNVTHSLALACAMLGINFVCAGPAGYQMNNDILIKAHILADKNGSIIKQTDDPESAAQGADIIYTDTWVSMGCEAEKEERLKIFQPYQVTQELMKKAKPDALFMHDMPAYRGNEVTSEVIDGHQSIIYQQAENRLHAQKALLVYLLT
ncbi:MAG: ornithine carbamoyltransferase [Patescibacteria group bacterium]